MANELDIFEGGEIAPIVAGGNIAPIIKPLISEIHLFDTYIAGTTHLEDQSVLERVEIGDVLTFRREDNPYDENAILVLNPKGEKLGYVPACDNIIFARLMDAGKLLKAKVTDITQHHYYKEIDIGIYLVDF